MRAFHIIAALVYAIATIFAAFLTQGIIDGVIPVDPEFRSFLVTVSVFLTVTSLILFIGFGFAASSPRKGVR
jgi:O-antigen/teichoic acid export membrane protein